MANPPTLTVPFPAFGEHYHWPLDIAVKTETATGQHTTFFERSELDLDITLATALRKPQALLFGPTNRLDLRPFRLNGQLGCNGEIIRFDLL